MKFSCKTLSIEPACKTKLCAIVNVTPDSFSDGGKWDSTEKAVNHALELAASGADMLDIGGESTRPGSTFVPVETEIERVVPVIKAIKKQANIPISIDTWKSAVAEAALDAGADIVNDITGFAGDAAMPSIVARHGCGAIVMFNPVIFRPEHPSCKIFPGFNLNGSNKIFLSEAERQRMLSMQIIDAMKFYLERSIERAHERGVKDSQLMLDPGIGFGLTKKENLMLIKHIHILHDMNYEIFLGVSRKRFVVNILSDAGINVDAATAEGFANRDSASAILTAAAVNESVEVVRVHSVLEHKIAREIAYAVKHAEQTEDINFSAYKKS